MLKTKAILRRKDDYFEPKDCVIEKVIRLNSDDFQNFCGNVLSDQEFIKENSDICGRDENGNHRCLLVLDRDGDDGILVQSEGYDYARYSAYMPGAKYFVEACQEVQSMKFYCPLTAETFENMCEHERQFAEEGYHVDPEAYEDYIRDQIIIKNRLDGECGLAQYLDKELQDKVRSIIPDAKMVGDTLYGVFDVKITEELSLQELENLRDFVSGQASDGWGEGLEQHEIDTPDGDIYVHFWHSGDDYFMLTEQEFDMRINGQAQSDAPAGKSLQELFQELFNEKIQSNYDGFMSEWTAMTPDLLIQKAKEIATTKEVYNSLINTELSQNESEYLIRFENPLEAVRDRIMSSQEMGGDTSVDFAVWDICDKQDYDSVYPLDENYVQPDESQGMSM